MSERTRVGVWLGLCLLLPAAGWAASVAGKSNDTRDRGPETVSVRHAAFSLAQLTAIARAQPAVAISLLNKRALQGEFNAAGLDEGVTGMAKRYSLGDVQRMWDDPAVDLGEPFADGSGVVVESRQVAASDRSLMFEFVAYRVDPKDGSRRLLPPVVAMEFAAEPVQEQAIAGARDGRQQTLRLLDFALAERPSAPGP